MLEEAHALALECGHDDHAARALVNIASSTLIRHRADPRVAADIERSMRFARERELDGYVQYMLGARSYHNLLLGDWTASESDARASVALGEQPGVSLCPALITLGRLQARRGDPEAGATLDEAWRMASDTGELQRLGPAAAARAEHAWLEGDLDGVAAAIEPAWAEPRVQRIPWMRGELAYWLWRAGLPVSPHPDDPEPYARAVAGDWRAAAAVWERLEFPYERADALSNADDEDARLEALTIFDNMGATRAAARLRRRLREDGVRRIPRGPRPATRAAPGGLTPREGEVLALLAEGATNAEIAQALVISPKTVDHHVSSVLGKLGVGSRREAGAAAARLGLQAETAPG
jgi:DNA-binding CsgD family transcriptional regulator